MWGSSGPRSRTGYAPVKMEAFDDPDGRTRILLEQAQAANRMLRINAFATGVLALVTLVLLGGMGVGGYMTWRLYDDVVNGVTDPNSDGAMLNSEHVNSAARDAYLTIANTRDVSAFAANVTNSFWGHVDDDTRAYVARVTTSPPDEARRIEASSDVTPGARFAANAVRASSSLAQSLDTLDFEAVSEALRATAHALEAVSAPEVSEALTGVATELTKVLRVIFADPDLFNRLRDAVSSMADMVKREEFSTAVIGAAASVREAANKVLDEIDPADIKEMVHKISQLDVKTDVLPRIDRAITVIEWSVRALRRVGHDELEL